MEEQVLSQILSNFRQHEKDTGSLELQVIRLTARIKHLDSNFKKNPKDFALQQGLIVLVGRRRTFLSYLKKHNKSKYENLIHALELRK